MIKVTINNVTKLSEETLYQELEKHQETDSLYMLIDAELDRRAKIKQEASKNKIAKLMETEAAKIQLTEEIKAQFEGFKGRKMLTLVQTLGNEMIDDYSICDETYTVVSAVAHHFQESAWPHETLDQAKRKVVNLVYWRVRDRFIKNPTVDKLLLLKRLAG